jgi:kumamolisin
MSNVSGKAIVIALVCGALAGAGAAAGQQFLGNPGFENGAANPAPWVPTAGVIDNSPGEPPHSGLWKAWLDGYGTTHTDTLYQQVTIPAAAKSATLSFWLHIDTAEISTINATDTLKVQIRSAANAVLATLGTYSNLTPVHGFIQKTFSLDAFIGQTIRIHLAGVEDSSRQTSFVVDDFALVVQ